MSLSDIASSKSPLENHFNLLIIERSNQEQGVYSMTMRWIRIKNLKMCGTVCFSSRQYDKQARLIQSLRICFIYLRLLVIQYSVRTNFLNDIRRRLFGFNVSIILEQIQKSQKEQNIYFEEVKKSTISLKNRFDEIKFVILLFHVNFLLASLNYKTMTLHMKWLDFNFEAPYCRSSKAPHLEHIIRTSKNHQIKQHENRFNLSPQKALIKTTKKILNINRNANFSNLTITHFSDHLNEEEKTRAISSFKKRKENKINIVKKQMELFNEINRSIQNNKIRRYQEQILLEQAQIEATIAQHKIKRNWMTATLKGNKPRIRRDSIKTPMISSTGHEQQQEQKKPQASIDSDGQSIYDKLFPSRRFVQKKKSKGKVSPWHSSSPFY